MSKRQGSTSIRKVVGYSVPSKETDQLALNANTVRRQDSDFVRGIGGLQSNRGAATPETLERCLFVVDQRNHDIAGVGGFRAFEQRNVAIENAGFDHRV